ncbi:Polymerase/histidinol phosphatase-like protein [Pisolithus marmoratus]|nr:Polymerase/histidinol phosphatase-like protein [Pisolithus marmoratus]
MPFSHHSHSGQFCKHAKGTLEEVVLEAIKQGFRVYGLTEHVPRYSLDHLYPEEIEAGLSPVSLMKQFTDFLDEAHKLKSAYASQITLLVGLETEHITEHDLDMLSSILSEHSNRIEYIVGSVHHVHGLPIDFDRATFDDALRRFVPTIDADTPCASHTDQFLSAYFDAQYTLLKRFRPEIIGHLDLCRLYNPGLRFSEYPNAYKRLERNISFATSYGALFEFNAAALRKGWDTCYPGRDVVELIHALGGRFTLSDDSHGPQGVGQKYPEMRDYLRGLRVSELWFLSCPADGDVGYNFERGLTATRVSGEWWNDRFWKCESQTVQH